MGTMVQSLLMGTAGFISSTVVPSAKLQILKAKASALNPKPQGKVGLQETLRFRV